MKNKILYVEDNVDISDMATLCFGADFPNHGVITARSVPEVNNMVDDGTISLETIAVVCTDGTLDPGMGWDIVEGLREKGYTGPAIYTGKTRIPSEKEHLYSDRSERKSGPKLNKILRKYI